MRHMLYPNAATEVDCDTGHKASCLSVGQNNLVPIHGSNHMVGGATAVANA